MSFWNSFYYIWFGGNVVFLSVFRNENFPFGRFNDFSCDESSHNDENNSRKFKNCSPKLQRRCFWFGRWEMACHKNCCNSSMYWRNCNGNNSFGWKNYWRICGFAFYSRFCSFTKRIYKRTYIIWFNFDCGTLCLRKGTRWIWSCLCNRCDFADFDFYYKHSCRNYWEKS